MDAIHRLRTDREHCHVGDGIAAADVPEWSTEVTLQNYQPLGSSLTGAVLDAIVEGTDDVFSRGDGSWTFELETGKPGKEPAGPIWRRVF